ncbi:MAG: GNAT family N-acetyltransferase [Paenisporosarcina sp.]
MKELQSKNIHPSVRKLLSYAISEGAIDQEYKKYIHELNRTLYTWEIHGEPIGCIGMEFIHSNHCEIKHIAVSRAERGNGLGRKMIDFICDKYALTLVSAETDKDAVGFYRSYGFNVISLGEKYPGVERFLCEYERSLANNGVIDSRKVEWL